MQVDEAPIPPPGSSESSRGERQLLARVRPFAPWSRRTSGKECWAAEGTQGRLRRGHMDKGASKSLWKNGIRFKKLEIHIVFSPYSIHFKRIFALPLHELEW